MPICNPGTVDKKQDSWGLLAASLGKYIETQGSVRDPSLIGQG